MYDILVVGCGLSGITASVLLAEKGYSVIVLEQKHHLGGQIYDYVNDYGITVHKYGPHIFHTCNDKVYDLISRYTSLSDYQHKVMSYVKGNFIPFPINRLTLNEVFRINLSNEQEAAEFLHEEVMKSEFHVPAQSFRDVVVSQVGEFLYETFFKTYTEKQWQSDPKVLSPELAGRIPVRFNNDCRYFTDNHQGIPVNGYSEMLRKMLNNKNIHVELDCDYFNMLQKPEVMLTVYTGELDKFFSYKYGKLDYRSVNMVIQTYDLESFQPAAVVNYPDSREYTRITEFKKMTGDVSNKTTVCYEYPSSKGIPFYIVPNKKNMELRELYMREIEKLEDTRHFLFVGRLAEYKYYNMDAAMASVMNKVQQWMTKLKR